MRWWIIAIVQSLWGTEADKQAIHMNILNNNIWECKPKTIIAQTYLNPHATCSINLALSRFSKGFKAVPMPAMYSHRMHSAGGFVAITSVTVLSMSSLILAH